MTTKQQILNRLSSRLEDEITNSNPLKYLKVFSPDDYYDVAVSTLYLYTRPKKGVKNKSIIFVEVVCAIGHAVRSKLKQKKDSGLAAKTGAFLLYTFEELGLLTAARGSGANGHQVLIVNMIDDAGLVKLWSAVATEKVEKLPATAPYAPWAASRHGETGASLVKTFNREVLTALTPESHPLVFECINKAQKTGWRVNEKVYDLQVWAFKNKTDAFADIWEQSNPDAKASKLRETKAIGDIAKRMRGQTFYHLYYYDFRGRKYPTTAYLHEQGSDLARGLLLRDDEAPIGEPGFFWLMVTIASNWAGDAGRQDGAKTDKIPLQDRFEWAVSNEEIFLAYATQPKVHQGWMKADKPWQFIAACFELKKFRDWQNQFLDRPAAPSEANALLTMLGVDPYDYYSGFEAYIDGSNNGSQHLAALTKDEVTAPHVNLVPLALPGDLYKYVGEHVWARLEARVGQMDAIHVAACNAYIDKLIKLKQELQTLDHKSLEFEGLVAELQAFKADNVEIAKDSAPVFWCRVTDMKHRRKIVKRNVMTLPYGGTPYGLGEQQIADAKKHSIDLLFFMEHRWGAAMGREVFEDCKTSLERPMRLLSVFESAGRAAEERGECLGWTAPITNFPVVQNYKEGAVNKIWVQYGPPKGERLSTGYFKNTYQLAVCFVEALVPSKGKQASGASPNAIHSLDAAHLTLTVCKCPFPVTTIHDSFGCLLRDMPVLFKTVRETFVELYKSDPLTSLMKAIGGDASKIEIGNLDIELVKDSEYCFS